MKLYDNYGVDTFKGETVWTNNHYNCEEQDFVVLFDGPASLITSITNDNSTLYTDIVRDGLGVKGPGRLISNIRARDLAYI
jgi:hypothetical protein